MINAINHNFRIKSKDEKLSIDKYTERLHISLWDKIKLILNVRPNTKMKMFLEKGEKRINQQLDLLETIKQHKKMMKYIHA